VETAPDVEVGDVTDPTVEPPVQGVPVVVSLHTEKTTVPVGAVLPTPVTVAESDVDEPRAKPLGLDGVVVKEGVALETVKHSVVVEESDPPA
jgi:hypothetical protein